MLIKEYPKKGDTRIVIRFAWLPTILGDPGNGGKKIWLEKYESHEKYECTYGNYDSWDYWNIIETKELE